MVTKTKATVDTTNPIDLTDVSVSNLPDTRNLYQRLAAAKKNFSPITKNRINPHFKSKFTDLDSIIKAVEQPLLNEGLLLVGICQPMSSEAWVVGYRLVNQDNPDDKTEQTMPSQQYDPQKQGQAITYCRRYVLGLLLNLSIDEDDDGNSASAIGPAASTPAKTKGSQGSGQAFLPGQEDDW